MSNSEALIQKSINEYKSKPLQPLEIDSILRKFNRDDSSVDTFRDEYLRDPLFCLELITAGWEATQKRASHPFAADHAMSTIGLGGAKQRFEAVKKRKKVPLTQEVSFCLSSSLLAAEIAKQIGKIYHASNQTYWTALFYGLPDTLLWYLKPKTMWRIYYRRLTLPKKIELFEEAKLGFSLHNWREAIAKEFHLSEQSQILFNKQLPSNPIELFEYAQNGCSKQTPSLIDWHRYEGWLIVLANRLARSVIAPWHGRSTLHCFKLLKQLTAIDINKLNSTVNQSVRVVSQRLAKTPLMVPAIGLLADNSRPPFPDWLTKPQLSQKAQIAQMRVKKKKPKSDTQARIAEILNKLTNDVQNFESSTTLVHYGLTALIDLLGFNRVSFLTVDHKNSKVVTRIALTAKDKPKTRPDFDFSKSTPLKKFVEQQAFMFISREKHKNIWNKLPYSIQRERVEKFILCSLKPGQRVRAIVYADSTEDSVFSERRIVVVKRLLNAVNQGLMLRNQAKKTQPGSNSQAG